MEKFDRIVREALVMGGQARIRDTGITVNEIVRLSLDGKSQAEILEQFPSLEAEDVHQAMGYTVDVTTETTLARRSLMRNRLASAAGYLTLMLEAKPSENTSFQFSMNEQVSEFMEVSLRSIRDTRLLLDEVDQLLKPHGFESYDFDNENDIEVVDLETIFAKKYVSGDKIKRYSPLDFKKLTVIRPEYLPSILSFSESYNLELIIEILAQRYIEAISQSSKNPEVRILVEDDLVIFRISRWVNLSDYGKPMIMKDQLFNITSIISIASYVLYRAGHQLNVEIDHDRVIFEFELPIVDDK